MAKADKRARKRENQQKAKIEREAAAQRAKRNRLIKMIAGGIAAIVVVVGVASLLKDDTTKKVATTTTVAPITTTIPPTTTTTKLPAGCVATKPAKAGNGKTYPSAPAMTIDTNKKYTATFETSCGTFTAELDSKVAPKTVNSFVFLAKEKFYDGLSFHRVAKDFVIQGGDPQGNGQGGPGYSLPDEPPAAAYKVGSLAMANSGANTSGSQFFVTTSEIGAKNLGAEPPFKYSSLGVVTSGMDVVTRLESLADPAANPNDPSTQIPTHPLYILKVTVAES